MGEYGYSEKRKTKNDARAKRRVRQFKRGGRFRTANIENRESR